MWAYAELSKTAKSFGGPKKYCNALVSLGKKSMYPVVVAAGAGGLVVGMKIKDVVAYYKKKKAVSSRVAKTGKHMQQIEKLGNCNTTVSKTLKTSTI